MEQYKVLTRQSVFSDVTPDELSLLVYLIGICLAQSLTIDELRVMGSSFFLTGEVLLTIAAQRVLLNDELTAMQNHQEPQSTEELQAQIKKLQSQIQHLQQQLDLLE